MKYIGDDDVVSVPPYRTQCGRRIMIYRLGNWDPRKYSVEEIFKATIIILELGVLEPRAQILGGTVIFDLEGITMAHAWTITPQVSFKKFSNNRWNIYTRIYTYACIVVLKLKPSLKLIAPSSFNSFSLLRYVYSSRISGEVAGLCKAVPLTARPSNFNNP